MNPFPLTGPGAAGVGSQGEIKGYEDEEHRAKHEAAHRWIAAVNNWGRLGFWDFEVCRDPQRLGEVLRGRASPTRAVS